MQLMIVTDIFGAQPELMSLFIALDPQVVVIQPYDDQPPAFTDDAQAYSYFLRHGGIDAYSDRLTGVLRAQTNPVLLLGFSAGAAACWAVSAIADLPIQRCIGFYGSQIRQLVKLDPRYPIELIFSEESHFSVPELMQTLEGKANLTQSQVSYTHGFMNPLSRGYQPQAADLYYDWIAREIRKPK